MSLAINMWKFSQWVAGEFVIPRYIAAETLDEALAEFRRSYEVEPRNIEALSTVAVVGVLKGYVR